MTTATIRANGPEISVTVKGHAGAPRTEHDNDIVCAAVSVLSQTLLECMIREQDAGALDGFKYRAVSGDIEVNAIPRELHTERVKTAVRTVATGFILLSKAYPDNVRVVMTPF
jgi:uncharacterized protein YsxB (DUF464 family)